MFCGARDRRGGMEQYRASGVEASEKRPYSRPLPAGSGFHYWRDLACIRRRFHCHVQKADRTSGFPSLPPPFFVPSYLPLRSDPADPWQMGRTCHRLPQDNAVYRSESKSYIHSLSHHPVTHRRPILDAPAQNLVAEAKKHLATPIIAPLNTDDVPSTAETAAQSPAAPSSDAAAESTADDGEEKNEEAEIVVEDARTKEVKDRARRILTAVGIDCWSV